MLLSGQVVIRISYVVVAEPLDYKGIFKPEQSFSCSIGGKNYAKTCRFWRASTCRSELKWLYYDGITSTFEVQIAKT